MVILSEFQMIHSNKNVQKFAIFAKTTNCDFAISQITQLDFEPILQPILQLETEIDQLRRRIEYNQEVLEKRDKEIGNLERQLQRAKSDSRTAESELRHLREIDENSSKIRYFKI